MAGICPQTGITVALEGSSQIVAAALPDSFTPTNAIGIESAIVNPSELFTANISASLTDSAP